MPIKHHHHHRRAFFSQDSWLKLADEAENDDDCSTQETYCGSDSESSLDGESSSSDDGDAALYFWRKCQSTFRRSTQDLLSDDVDPIAERHMLLPGAPGAAPMPPFSFYCQEDRKHRRKNNLDLADELDYFSDFPVKTQRESPQRQRRQQQQRSTQDSSSQGNNWYQRSKSSNKSNLFLLHRFARC